MALVLDTGVLYGGYDRDDRDHASCRTLIESARERRVIPAPVLVELNQLFAHRSPSTFDLVLAGVESGSYLVEALAPADHARVRALLRDYADLRVGFVDAAVLAVVERLGEPKLATLDRRHFCVMRPRHVNALELLPA